MPAATVTIETTEAEPVLKENLETILIMGLDKYQAPEQTMGYLNDQQNDFLLLVILDRDHGSCDLLHLNRDTMTEIRRLGVGGGDAGRFIGQLALAHTYGSGGSDSCLNTTRAVSDFLGIPVQHYLSVTMEAVGVLNDLVGGVTLELMDDMTVYDPALVKGETVTLMGDQALWYVRARGSLEDSSNLHRMERQRQYLEGLYEALRSAIAEDENFLRSAMMKLNPYMQTDFSINAMDELGERLMDCTPNPIRYIEGEAVKGEEFIEFYPDEASKSQVIRDLFYEP